MVKAISSYDEYKQLVSSGKPVIIDFWATWCGPCKMISPHFEKMEKEKDFENVVFAKVDVDEQQQIAQECGIRAMPTFQLFKDGKKVDDVTGAVLPKLQALVKKAASA